MLTYGTISQCNCRPAVVPDGVVQLPTCRRGVIRGAKSGCVVRLTTFGVAGHQTIAAGRGSGRRSALPWQSKGQGFESPQLHPFSAAAELSAELILSVTAMPLWLTSRAIAPAASRSPTAVTRSCAAGRATSTHQHQRQRRRRRGGRTGGRCARPAPSPWRGRTLATRPSRFMTTSRACCNHGTRQGCLPEADSTFGSWSSAKPGSTLGATEGHGECVEQVQQLRGDAVAAGCPAGRWRRRPAAPAPGGAAAAPAVQRWALTGRDYFGSRGGIAGTTASPGICPGSSLKAAG